MVQKQELVFRAPGVQTLRKLSFREASVLGLLIEAQGEVVENEILLQEYWSGDSVYNLNGTKVDDNSLGKGIYIKNGKKVIIK